MSVVIPHIDCIAFVADTQAPMFIEKLWLKPFQNKKATDLIFENIIRTHLHSFFHLGDVVNLGYSDRQWRRVDNFLQAIREKGAGLYGILGNHEVMGRPVVGESKFQVRFPDHQRTGYSVMVDSVAVVLLNSNFQTLSVNENQQQIQWFRSVMEDFDGNPAVDYVITCCHHSPFTNSRIVKPSRAVQEKFLPVFFGSRKSQLFLSGHAHAFEHFQVKGKDFMVIGGGGGLTQPLRRGIGTLTDLAEGYKPMFHYITVTPSGDHLEVRSYHLKKDFSGFEEGLKHDVKKWMDTVKKVG